jgi:threonine dehydrogenase-like Zn-dependent dehydrogenase
LRGYYPYTGIPGHEFVGEVTDSAADPSIVGKRVVGEINIACGKCATCRAGLPRHCENRKTLGIHDWDGVFAEYIVLPLENIREVPDEVADEQAIFTEPLAAACEILEQVQIKNTDNVLVIGAGRLGQLIAQVLQTTGCDLEVVARYPRQQKLLMDRRLCVRSEAEIEPRKYDIIVEATGAPQGFLLARKSIRPRGTIVLKSTYTGDSAVNFSGIVVDEVTLVGSRCGPFSTALQFMASGLVDPHPLIEAEYSLEQGLVAFEHASRPGALKVLIRSG